MRVNSDLLNNVKPNNVKPIVRGYESVEKFGQSQVDINVVLFKENLKKYYAKEVAIENGVGNKVTLCAAIGGALGGTLGAMIGAIAAVGTTLVLPGFGLVIAGPIAAAVAGAGAGGLFAGLVGAFIGWLTPEDHILAYKQNIHDGGSATNEKSKFENNVHQFDNQWFDNQWKSHHGKKMHG